MSHSLFGASSLVHEVMQQHRAQQHSMKAIIVLFIFLIISLLITKVRKKNERPKDNE